MMNPVPWLQMTNMISYQGLVRTFLNAVLTRGINLADDDALNGWLKKNDIDVEKYHQIRQSQAVAERLKYMAKITELYDINATPLFIVNKKYVVAKDRQFPEFADYMRQLLTQDKE
ncbi:DsbA family protein [Klebsiella oxytoca]|uniref:DsbA family protein n=1 Tax=Klebsiella oxytoca TaxID=571 RepID=UPI0034D95AA1